MNYKFENGLFYPDFELSELERKLFREFEDLLASKGFKYLSLPSAMIWRDLEKQEVIKREESLGIDNIHSLNGSAEQSILHYFKNQTIQEDLFIFAKNQCFRFEDNNFEDCIRCKEFIKLEQFCFTEKNNWKKNFNLLLNNSIEFLNNYNIKHRIVNVTDKDKGYHILKYDIEILTKKYGWLETHSCSYFGEEQTKRFNIKGGLHSISNTGIASPRILIPFIEKVI